MQTNVLIVSDVPQALPSGHVADKELGVKAPGEYGLRHEVIFAVHIDPLRHFKEDLLATAVAARGVSQSTEVLSLVFSHGKEFGIHKGHQKLTLQILNVCQRLLAKEILPAELELLAAVAGGGEADPLP